MKARALRRIGLSAKNAAGAGCAARRCGVLAWVALLPVAVLTACGGGNDAAGPDTAQLQASLRSLSAAYADESFDALTGSADAMALGGQLFAVYCGHCHGGEGPAARDVPDLSRGGFDYGASAEAVRATITRGRRSEMPGVGREYGEVELGQIVSYLGTFGSDEPLSEYDARGQVFYAEACVACHGEDGKGQTELGAPDLTDDYWQHGDSMINKRMTVTRGVQSECPAHGDELSDAEISLLTAFTLQLAGR